MFLNKIHVPAWDGSSRLFLFMFELPESSKVHHCILVRFGRKSHTTTPDQTRKWMRSTPRNSRKISQDIQVLSLYFIVLKQITPTIFPLEHPTRHNLGPDIPWVQPTPWGSKRPMKLIHWPSRNAGCFFRRGETWHLDALSDSHEFFVIWGLGSIKRPHSSSMSSWCSSMASVLCCRSKSYMHCLSGCRFVEI